MNPCTHVLKTKILKAGCKTQCSEDVVGYVGDDDVNQYADTSQTKIGVYLFI